MIIRIIVLVGLIRLLLVTNKPFLCSGIYAGVIFFFGLITEVPFIPLIVVTAIGFALSSLYFWLLERFEGAGVLWWVILIGGLLIGLV